MLMNGCMKLSLAENGENRVKDISSSRLGTNVGTQMRVELRSAFALLNERHKIKMKPTDLQQHILNIYI